MPAVCHVPLGDGALDQADDLLVVDCAGGRDDDVSGRVLRTVVGLDRALRDAGDHVGGSDHRPPERVRPEHRLSDQIVHELLRCVLVHRNLLEHDFPLGVELVEERREDHVAHHIERLLDVHVRDASVDDGVLARGRGVQLAAELVEQLRDLERRVLARPLEQQVLDEVRDAGLGVGLVARAGADPVADRGRADVVEPLADHSLARIELAQNPVVHSGMVLSPRSGPSI